jgi:hypothetical protein
VGVAKHDPCFGFLSVSRIGTILNFGPIFLFKDYSIKLYVSILWKIG